jgi:alpha,alpha-trehalase
MAGTVDLVQRCFTGMVTRGDVLWLNPCLPDELSRLSMTVCYRGRSLDLRVTPDWLDVRADQGDGNPITIGVRDAVYPIQAGEKRRFPLLDSESEPSPGH